MTVEFTPAQLDRLKRAAAQIGQGVTGAVLVLPAQMAS